MIELRVNSGLCNRMRAMTSALALSRAAQVPLKVYWFNTRALNCPFGKLFEPIAGVEVTDVATGRLRPLVDPGALRLRSAGRKKPYDLFLSGEKIEELAAEGVDLADAVKQVERCGIETYGRFYGTEPRHEDLIPKAALASEAAKTWTDVLGDGEAAHTLGVHIRRGDNDASIQVSPLELFIARMEQAVADDPWVRFFLATDDPVTERTVKEHFPDRVIVRRKDFSRTRTRGVQDALVDLLVLSRCPVIVGSYWSSFTQTAAEMGGSTLEIVRAQFFGPT